MIFNLENYAVDKIDLGQSMLLSSNVNNSMLTILYTRAELLYFLKSGHYYL